jgi:F-box/leucine-rich repeat protein 7
VPNDLIRIVLTLPLFEPIQTDEALVTQLCKALHLRMYQPGDHIIRQKDVAKGMFFIIRGSVTVTSDDGEVLFAELNAPGYCKFLINS